MAILDASASDGSPRAGTWRLGAAVLDERSATLRVGGTEVPLDRSGYDVLLALLRHAGEVVTKDELLEAGWPGRIVSENSLAKAVGRLRQALGEDGAAIRVVHGYGYRLAAPIAFQPLAPDASAAPADSVAHLHAGDALPHRPGWRLERRLGEGGAGVIFLAHGSGTEPPRAVKFATGEAGLRSLKREIALTRYLRAVRPDQADVAPVLDWNLSQPPFFLARPYFADGHLADWTAARGGLDQVPLQERLAMFAGLCEAVAALHEAGILHKDLKPENLYPVRDGDGGWRLVLSDLGAGEAAHAPRLLELGITLTIAATASVSQAGTALYMAPEVIAGELPTQRSDVFALGVLLYQMVAGNLRRSLAPGWENDVADALLREDIALAAAANPDRRQVDARDLAERVRTLAARHAEREARIEREALLQRQERELARMARRRRLLAAGSAVLVLVLGLSLWHQHRISTAHARAEQAARRAEAEAARSRSLVAFLTDGVLRQADPFAGAGGPVTLRQAIDRAARDVDARFGKDPQVAAAIHGTLAAAYEGQNDFGQAVAHYRAQVSGLLRVPGAPAAELAQARSALCLAWLWQGDVAQARQACAQARADFVRAGQAPDRAEVFLALADTREDRHVDALRRIEPRLERIRRSGDDELYGYALWFAGTAYGRLGRPVDVERVYARLVDLRRRREGDPSMLLAWALADHGRAQLVLGRDAAGRAELARAEAMFARVAGKDHPHVQTPRVHLAMHALALGRWREAHALAEPAYRRLHAASGWQNWTIYAALAAMTAAAEAGDAPAARAIMAEFDALAAMGLDRDFPYLREPHWIGYAATHLALGEHERARRYVADLKALAAAPGASPLLQARVDCLEGALLRADGFLEQARERATACRARIADAATARSPLLREADRLLASLDAPGDPTQRQAGR